MATLIYILAAVVLLGLCIFVHELGHLLGGMMVGIKARVFSIGYGKGFIKKRIGDTTYQLTLIPFGGYCQFYGDDPSEERKGESYEFLTAHPVKRIVTVIMGPLFNLLFGILLFFMMNMIGYDVETNRIHIPDYFTRGEYVSPAYESGMRSGDAIVGINGKRIASFQDIQNSIVFSDGRPAMVRVLRDGREMEFAVAPKRFSEKGYYTIGVMPYGERVLVARSLEKDAAEEAGIRQYDEVKAIDGRPVKTPAEFTAHIRANAGRELHLLIVRGGREMELPVTPRLKETITIREFEDARFKGERMELSTDKLDLVKNGIASGSVKINGERVASIADLQRRLERNKGQRVRLETAGGDNLQEMKLDVDGQFFNLRLGRHGEISVIKCEGHDGDAKEIQNASRQAGADLGGEFRLLARKGMIEAYLGGHFLECCSLDCPTAVHIRLLAPENGSSEGFRAWQMSL